MQDFIHRKNLENFRQRLTETLEGPERERLLKLLAEEVAKEPAFEPKSS